MRFERLPMNSSEEKREPEKMENKEQKEKELTKKEKAAFLEVWTSVVGGEKFNPESLTNEELRKELYESLKPAIEESLDKLGIKLPEELIEKMQKTENIAEKAMFQKEIVEKLSGQLKEIPFTRQSFFPRQIQETKSLNCSGSALLNGYILNKLGIKTFLGTPVGHALNVTELADGSWLYVDSRNRAKPEVIGKDKIQIREQGNIRILKIDIPGVEYKIIPLLPEEGALTSVVGNLESLKTQIKKGEKLEEGQKEAAEIYDKYKDLLESLNFEETDEKLHSDLINYLNSEEFGNESNRVKEMRDFPKRLNEIVKDLTEEEQKEIGKELKNRLGLVKSLIMGKETREDFSDKTKEYLEKVKKALEPLRNQDFDEAERELEESIIKPIRNFNG